MKKILPLLTLPLLLWGASDKQIIEFAKRAFSNPTIKIKDIQITERRNVEEINGWEAVRMIINADIKGKGDIRISEMLFSKGEIIAPELFLVGKNQSLKTEYQTGILSGKEIDKEHFVAGLPNAKYKVAVFSDPECPFCKDFVIDAIETAQKYPSLMALYYFHFPLTAIHPDSPTLIKAMIVARNKGVKDIIARVYKVSFDLKTTNEEEILKIFTQKTGVAISRAEINNPTVLKQYEDDINLALWLGVRGTPAVFVNGNIDPHKTILEKIAKEGKK